jgi:hypothetical protein
MARAGPEAHDSQHIHDKAVFDGASQALAHLLPPYGTVLTDGQRRVRREEVGGQKWRCVLLEEVVKRVVSWSTAREWDDLDALLAEDIKTVPSADFTLSFLVTSHGGDL